jgi:hypothetical protein
MAGAELCWLALPGLPSDGIIVALNEAMSRFFRCCACAWLCRRYQEGRAAFKMARAPAVLVEAE